MVSRQTQKMSVCSLPTTQQRMLQAASLMLVAAAILAGQLLLQALPSVSRAKQKRLPLSPQLNGPEPENCRRLAQLSSQQQGSRSNNPATQQ